jgi:hypothetical protein
VQPNQPTHDISLPRRSLRDCLSEELRRLDPDDLFGDVIQSGLGQLGKVVPHLHTGTITTVTIDDETGVASA